MTTIYLNFRGCSGPETVDSFTQGVDAPTDRREFLSYVGKMIAEYHLAGISVYKSRRPCQNWK